MQVGRDSAYVYPIDQTGRLKRDRLTALPFSGARRFKGRTAGKCGSKTCLE